MSKTAVYDRLNLRSYPSSILTNSVYKSQARGLGMKWREPGNKYCVSLLFVFYSWGGLALKDFFR